MDSLLDSLFYKYPDSPLLKYNLQHWSYVLIYQFKRLIYFFINEINERQINCLRLKIIFLKQNKTFLQYKINNKFIYRARKIMTTALPSPSKKDGRPKKIFVWVKRNQKEKDTFVLPRKRLNTFYVSKTETDWNRNCESLQNIFESLKRTMIV